MELINILIVCGLDSSNIKKSFRKNAIEVLKAIVSDKIVILKFGGNMIKNLKIKEVNNVSGGETLVVNWSLNQPGSGISQMACFSNKTQITSTATYLENYATAKCLCDGKAIADFFAAGDKCTCPTGKGMSILLIGAIAPVYGLMYINK